MSITVIDSSNLSAVLADAGYPEPEAVLTAEPEAPAVEAQDEFPAYLEADEVVEHADDDKEGADGLTPREKRELTSKMLKSIGKRVAQRKAAEEFADAQYQEKLSAERRGEDLERQLKELKGRIEPQAQPDNSKPDRSNYVNEENFIEALTDWKTDQKFAQRDAEQAQAAAQTRMRSHLQRANELVDDFAAVTAAANFSVPQNIAEYLADSDLIAELGYHFAKNPDVMKRLHALSPVKQLVELGKIEGKLTPFDSRSEPKAGVKPATNGAPPKPAPSTLDTGFTPSKARIDAPVIRPLMSGEGQQVEPEVRDMDTRQTIASWQKANKANLNLRRRH